MTTLILGAGMTAITCEHPQSCREDVIIYDKARPSGRMASRRSDVGTFDHVHFSASVTKTFKGCRPMAC